MDRVNEDFTKRGRLSDIGRWYVTRFLTDVAAEVPSGHKVLDAGAGECAYKSWFAHCRYLGVDLGVGDTAWNYTNLDSFARLEALPFRTDSFDAVVCTQVLEHVERPQAVLAEFVRVLKPAGTLYLTAPMSHAEHQAPHDYFRYTSWGLRSLCEKAGFDEVDVRAFGGLFVRWAYEAPRGTTLLSEWAAGGGQARRLGMLPLLLALRIAVRFWQILFLGLDRLDSEKSDPFGWRLTARKPGAPAAGEEELSRRELRS